METHTGWSLIGRNPYGARHWYVANELAYLTGARKMTATASLMAPVWQEVMNGNVAWGDADRLNKLWCEATTGLPQLDPDPSRGIAQLIQEWAIPRLTGCSEETVQHVAAASLRNWGGALPMLKGLRMCDVLHVLRCASRNDLPEGKPRSARERR